jgi:hypothetical protein
MKVEGDIIDTIKQNRLISETYSMQLDFLNSGL